MNRYSLFLPLLLITGLLFTHLPSAHAQDPGPPYKDLLDSWFIDVDAYDSNSDNMINSLDFLNLQPEIMIVENFPGLLVGVNCNAKCANLGGNWQCADVGTNPEANNNMQHKQGQSVGSCTIGTGDVGEPITCNTAMFATVLGPTCPDANGHPVKWTNCRCIRFTN